MPARWKDPSGSADGRDVPGQPAGVAPSVRSGAQWDRQRRIRERVSAVGFLRTADLAAEFGVSLMTIHRDFDVLQAQGWLRKVRGGATAVPSAMFHGDVEQRMAANPAAKRRLAAAALDLVVPGQVVMLDESTTCLYLAQRLAERTPLTLVTYFQPVVELLAGTPGITLIALGGEYFPAYDAFLGLYTAEGVAKVRADTVFLSTTAISHGRCYHQSQETVAVKRALMAAASRRVLLVDHTKFARQGLYALAALADFDLVLVDEGLPPAEQRRLRDTGVALRVVPTR
ncbi:DNA-binding transcriptional regulator of sugar metabolism, DeoR/GlpR family [Amycolatopsis arida]|uniref:Lactose phosphotransferase system repressor n=1 Tax=Amycolatopsis arida TaxID=587909 RepID=A0A1I5V9X9_9PSEU|nr:DeoR/GlpR family DNA-binding transcription regulator [Amycolatopsis arida]TDX91203.1 DeoR/GlpR family transcriptional regulator of sugar metabolism [Amycolatopsis arida]SFQ04305.1 DNA-binding transcriptional regulator of sugar metabolism, DeoR/GlpR family [Amycolatopsis arida]